VDYDEGIERSTELLRRALPLMSRQAAGLHPISYAVWYDYVAQTNPALHAAVDELIARDGQLDETSTRELFRRHVADMDTETAQRMTDGFAQVLAGMAQTARAADNQTASFGQSLGRLSAELETGAEPEPAALADVLADVLAGTHQMQQAMGQLRSRLDDSQREIERLREEVRRARHDATVDALTGLANRRAFDQQLAACLVAPQDALGPCLLVGDIDHFKSINDTWGHGFGDQVLRAVAEVLKVMAPQGSQAARVGGEEFALLLPAATLDGARTLAEQIRQRIGAARIRRQGSDETVARVTLSLGVVRHQPGETAHALVERADRALYAAKAAGRDRVVTL
jgi:diguanylate cyclase